MTSVRMYQPTKGLNTMCCETTSKGRTCSVCGNIPEEKVYLPYDHAGYKHFTYEETEKQVTLGGSFSQVVLTDTHLFWKWADHTIKFVYDKETKEVHLFQNIDRIKRNKPYSPVSDVESFHLIVSTIRAVRNGLITHFLTKCLRLSGVLYKKPHDFKVLEKEGWKHFNSFCQEPNLQHVPLTFFPTLTEHERRSIRHTPKGKDIMKQLTGHNTRSMIQWCTNQNRLDMAKLWGPYFQKPDNIMRILTQVSEGNCLGIDDRQMTYFQKGMDFLSKLHPNETVWANRLISLLQKKKNVSTGIAIIGDLFHMYENIKRVEETYVLPFEGDIKQCHDWVSKDFKLLVQYPCITYTYDRQTEWEKEIDEYVFQLPKDSHELSRIGSDMRICVGSYSDLVESGNSTIMWMKKPEADTVDVCIQINKHERIVQAKTMRNELPDAKLCNVIRDWAKKCELTIITEDIRYKEMQND